MNEQREIIQKWRTHIDGTTHSQIISLYPGITLYDFDLTAGDFSMQHEALAHVLQINYCHSGQIVWQMQDETCIYLGPGDFSLHTMQTCARSSFSFPTGHYAGLTICLDRQILAAEPQALPPRLAELAIKLPEKFCQDNTASFFAGNAQTESIFSAFYDQPETVARLYQQLKTAELILYLTKLEVTAKTQLTAYQAEQIAIVREIHDHLLEHLEDRVTIDELAKQYLLNPTTLKAAFKSVYGTSLAAHIKMHRLEQAAKLLKETDKSIAEIAQAVGYDSQSKFTAAFKSAFHVLPKDYRKQ